MLRMLTPVLAWAFPMSALAEVELSFYGGFQASPHSVVTITGDPEVADAEFDAGWEGRSFEAPPYYGIRATWWRSATFGIGADFTHAKVYADDETLAETGYEVLEFTDGINILTVNAYHRWPDQWPGVTPYLGGGLGVSIPHVELTEGTSRTAGYQLTGPAVAWIAGASYAIDDSWSVFGEYKGTYSVNEADLDTGGTLETNIITNALNFGVSYSF